MRREKGVEEEKGEEKEEEIPMFHETRSKTKTTMLKTMAIPSVIWALKQH